MRKEVGLSLLILSMFPIISAEPAPEAVQFTQEIINSAIGVATPIFQFIIGDYSTNEFFATKVMMLILLFVVIQAILKKVNLFDAGNSVAIVIAAVISIIAIRFISENQLTLGILLPYGTLGIVILTSLSLMIVFYFIHTTNLGSIGRRLIWSFFALVYIMLFIYRYNELGSLTRSIYGWSIALIIFFLIFDRGIHRYFSVWELNTFYHGADQKTIAALQAEYLNIINLNTTAAVSRRHAIERQLRSLGASLP